MELILVNLVSNAIKYSDPAKPAARRGAAGRGAARGLRRSCVRDNGVGIAPEHLPRIFERAYRAHADRDEELGTDGFGLGLAIVRDCVDDQGGQVTVESVLGEGATFTVTLPTQSAGLRRPPSARYNLLFAASPFRRRCGASLVWAGSSIGRAADS